MKLQHFYYSCCGAAVLLAIFIFTCQIRPAKAQTVGQVEATVKARPVTLGPLDCRGPVINSDKKQVLADVDFKALQAAAKVDSGKTCSQYKVVPLSAALAPKPKGIIEKVMDFIFGG